VCFFRIFDAFRIDFIGTDRQCFILNVSVFFLLVYRRPRWRDSFLYILLSLRSTAVGANISRRAGTLPTTTRRYFRIFASPWNPSVAETRVASRDAFVNKSVSSSQVRACVQITRKCRSVGQKTCRKPYYARVQMKIMPSSTCSRLSTDAGGKSRVSMTFYRVWFPKVENKSIASDCKVARNVQSCLWSLTTYWISKYLNIFGVDGDVLTTDFDPLKTFWFKPVFPNRWSVGLWS